MFQGKQALNLYLYCIFRAFTPCIIRRCGIIYFARFLFVHSAFQPLPIWKPLRNSVTGIRFLPAS